MPRAKPKPEPKTETPAEFWAGAFGTAYTERNQVDWEARIPFWRHIVETTDAASFLEVGANAGWNLRALRAVFQAAGRTEVEMSGVDVNEEAAKQAVAAGLDVAVCPANGIKEMFGDRCAHITFTAGVLIHIPPHELLDVMTQIRDTAAHYVLAVEYDADEQREVEYRGHAGRLWCRPFGKLYEQLGLSLVEHGEAQGFDQCHWWLLEKS